MPSEIDPEYALIGAMILSGEPSIREARSLLGRGNAFKSPKCQTAYGLLCRFLERSQLPSLKNEKALDPGRLAELMKEEGKLEEVGGASFLTECINATPDPGGVKHYAQSILRQEQKRAQQQVAILLKEGEISGEEATQRLEDIQGSYGDIGQSFAKPLTEIEESELTPLWGGRIMQGKLGILAGRMDRGKSLLLCDLAARFSTRTPLPNQQERPDFKRTLFLSAEDAAPDTIKPRLRVAQADMEHIYILNEVPGEDGPHPPIFPDDVPVIRREVEQKDIGLIVVDPIAAYLDSDVNTYNDADVRRVLSHLSDLADETDTAIIAVKHFRKSGNQEANLAVGGSIAFTAAARFSLVVGKHPQDEDRRVLAPAKNNLATQQPSLEFQIRSEQGRPRIHWEGTTNVTADDIASNRRSESKRDQAKSLIEDALKESSKSAQALFDQADRKGISERTMRRAADDLDVHKEKRGFEGGWIWTLPAQNGEADDLKEVRI